MKHIYVLLLVFIFISRNEISGQKFSTFPTDPNTPFDPYFVETRDTVSTHGPHTITRNMLQDKKGNFWFATWQGIIKYDGKLFTNMTLKEGLIHFHVLTVLEDKTGILWFGTVRGGLYRYDPSASPGTGGKSFTLFTTKDGLAGNIINCMLEDKAGAIWFGTDGGLSRYDPSASSAAGGKPFTNFTTKEGLGGNDVWTMLQDKTGKLWFGSSGDGGISCYDASATPGAGGNLFTIFTNKEGLPFKGVTSLLEDRTGNIWIGRRDGLCRYDPSLKTGSKSFTDLLPNFIGYLFQDKTGNVWLSVSEPTAQLEQRQLLYRYDARLDGSAGHGNSFTKIIDKYNPWDWQVFGICEDKTGNIWFGTMRGAGRYDGKYSHYFWE